MAKKDTKAQDAPADPAAGQAQVVAAAANGWDAPSVYALNGHLDVDDPDD